MRQPKIPKSPRLAGLLAFATARATDNTVVIAQARGKQIARFMLADSRCVLKDEQIRCTLRKSSIHALALSEHRPRV